MFKRSASIEQAQHKTEKYEENKEKEQPNFKRSCARRCERAFLGSIVLRKPLMYFSWFYTHKC